MAELHSILQPVTQALDVDIDIDVHRPNTESLLSEKVCAGENVIR